jgi:hypothetical protein
MQVAEYTSQRQPTPEDLEQWAQSDRERQERWEQFCRENWPGRADGRLAHLIAEGPRAPRRSAKSAEKKAKDAKVLAWHIRNRRLVTGASIAEFYRECSPTPANPRVVAVQLLWRLIEKGYLTPCRRVDVDACADDGVFVRCGKKIWPTFEEARVALAKAALRFSPRRREQRIYYCRGCDGYHLTSQPKWDLS